VVQTQPAVRGGGRADTRAVRGGPMLRAAGGAVWRPVVVTAVCLCGRWTSNGRAAYVGQLSPSSLHCVWSLVPYVGETRERRPHLVVGVWAAPIGTLPSANLIISTCAGYIYRQCVRVAALMCVRCKRLLLCTLTIAQLASCESFPMRWILRAQRAALSHAHCKTSRFPP